MVTQTVTGTIGRIEVEITLSGDDEQLANLLFADLQGHCDELNQIVELDRHPDATEPPMTADWEAYLNGELPRTDD